MISRICRVAGIALVVGLQSFAAGATPVEAPNKNSYEVIVAGDLSWDAANTAANAATYRGAAGHLATITSAAENAFIYDIAMSGLYGPQYWIGGFQTPGSSGIGEGWQWVNGEGAIPTSSFPVAGYSNWLFLEPNDSDGVENGQEDQATIGISGSLWNDSFSGVGAIGGYIIEYDNLIPVAMDDPDSGTIDAFTNETIVIDVFSNDTPGETPNTVVITQQPSSGGTASVNPDNTVTYKSGAGFGGVDTFKYRIDDGNGDSSAEATVTVTVDASEAVIETGTGVTVLKCVDDPNCNVPFSWKYQEVLITGDLVTECCAAVEPREMEGSGRGKRLWYNPRDLDVGQLLKDTPACAAAVDLLGGPAAIGDPDDVNGDGVVDANDIGIDVDGDGVVDEQNPYYVPLSVLRPWQRVYPDPALILSDNAVGDLYGNSTPPVLPLAICVVQSDAITNGIALISESPKKVLDTFDGNGDGDPDMAGYEVDCSEDRLAFRPLTAGTSVSPQEEDYPFSQPWTAECDAARSGKRSSTNIALLNTRSDTGQNGPKSTISRLLSDLRDEIVASSLDGCVDFDGDVTGPLLDQWTVAKNAVIKAKRNAAKIRSEAVPALNDLAYLALTTIPQCPENPKALITGRAMNASFMTCSYLGNPNSFDKTVRDSNDQITDPGSCPIDSRIEAIINPAP